MKICVIMPTYNEAGAIAGLVRQIRQQDLDILVIDDGSKDNTSQLARDNGAIVLRNEQNLGKGASLILGFDYVRKNNYAACITMDGDGQHSPQEISNFLDRASKSDSGIILGNRMSQQGSMPLARVLTNRFMSWLISRIAGQKIPDTQCGFRLIRREILEKVNLTTCRYETESEILIKSSRAGFKIESMPIKSIYLDEKSHINPFIDTLRFFRLILKNS